MGDDRGEESEKGRTFWVGFSQLLVFVLEKDKKALIEKSFAE